LIVKENGEYSDPIIIRAHHLLCMQGFQGYGYSKDFERHMEMIITFLNSNPSTEIQIITYVDEICSKCPYRVEGKCAKDRGIERIDNFVLEFTAIEENQIYSFDNAIKIVNNDLDHNDVMIICDKCSWKNKCLFFLENTA
jgi:uncharacterized protein